eukprot:3030317-Alexandrium_andersonii.AAC.1
MPEVFGVGLHLPSQIDCLPSCPTPMANTSRGPPCARTSQQRAKHECRIMLLFLPLRCKASAWFHAASTCLGQRAV